LAQLVNNGTSFYEKTITLMANIALNDTANWKTWNETNAPENEWVPIGKDPYAAYSFSGTFNGNGYAISGVYINDVYEYTGLFGVISGSVKNLGVVASYIKGLSFVGGLVGYNNSGTISNCYSIESVIIGTVTNSIGGLVGYNNSGTISNCYSIGTVTGGENHIGGLVGTNYSGTVNNSYSSGYVASLVDNNSGIVLNSDSKTSEQMKLQETYINWDFENIWDIDRFYNNGTPYLQWQNTMRTSMLQIESIEPQLYTGSQIKPTPKVFSQNGTTELQPGVHFDYHYGENIQVATGGIVYIVGKPGVFYGSLKMNFTIKPAITVNVYWYPECGAVYPYNGQPQCPQPMAADATRKAITQCETDAGIGHIAIARLETPEDDVVLQNNACPYTITPKELQVSWTPDSVFTYNKMTQAPVPSISEPSINLIRYNAHAAAGTYKGENAAAA
jgi:hypothetical protein